MGKSVYFSLLGLFFHTGCGNLSEYIHMTLTLKIFQTQNISLDFDWSTINIFLYDDFIKQPRNCIDIIKIYPLKCFQTYSIVEKAPRQLFHMSQCYLCSLNEPRNNQRVSTPSLLYLIWIQLPSELTQLQQYIKIHLTGAATNHGIRFESNSMFQIYFTIQLQLVNAK